MIYFSLQPVPMTGVTKAMVCVVLYVMMHIKELLQLIGRSSP